MFIIDLISRIAERGGWYFQTCANGVGVGSDLNLDVNVYHWPYIKNCRKRGLVFPDLRKWSGGGEYFCEILAEIMLQEQLLQEHLLQEQLLPEHE